MDLGFVLKVAMVLLLPVSFIWDLISFWRLRFRFWRKLKLPSHEEKVKQVQAQVRCWMSEGKGRKMCTGRPSWMSISGMWPIAYKDRMFKVQVHNLQDLIEINKEKMEVSVEPGMTIGFLNRLLVKEGLTLSVVPEIDYLTIGGLILGGGIESTSHKYGLFHKLATQYEMVSADSECIIASETKNNDLFNAMKMSYGTFGFLTMITLKVIKYKPWIRLEYHPSYSLEDTINIFQRETLKDKNNDSVEGISFSKDTAVIMTGTFLEEEEVDFKRTNRIGIWYKPWFYCHVKSFLGNSDRVSHIEYIPTLHFNQRHNKPIFWLIEHLLPWLHHPLVRFLTGWMLPFNYQFLQLVKKKVSPNDTEDRMIVQDFILPISHIKKGIELNENITKIYPLWLAPVIIPSIPESGMFVDLGVYGWSQLTKWPGKDSILRTFEKFTLEHEGLQALYADTLLTFEDFNQMFSPFHQLYVKTRARLPNCDQAFPIIYEKVIY